jgi:hypothetical protein
MRDEVVHVVMGSGIIFGVYRRAELAYQHARCVTGTTVATVELDNVSPSLLAILEAEILDALPAEIQADIQASEWEEDDEITPVVALEIPFDEIDE